jgi:hypothetical protein
MSEGRLATEMAGTVPEFPAVCVMFGLLCNCPDNNWISACKRLFDESLPALSVESVVALGLLVPVVSDPWSESKRPANVLFAALELVLAPPVDCRPFTGMIDAASVAVPTLITSFLQRHRFLRVYSTSAL